MVLVPIERFAEHGSLRDAVSVSLVDFRVASYCTICRLAIFSINTTRLAGLPMDMPARRTYVGEDPSTV